MAHEEKRWAWYGQIRDAVLLFAGVGLLIFQSVLNAYGKGADATLVTAGVTLALAGLTGVGGRWLVKRIENGDKP